MVVQLIEKFELQADLEIRRKILDPNDIGVHKWMFHWALTKCIEPKVHSQSTFMHQEAEIFWHLFIQNNRVNLAWVVVENMSAN